MVSQSFFQHPQTCLGWGKYIYEKHMSQGCLMQYEATGEYTAGMPGTTFSFDDPGEAHRESADVARAKAFLQRRQASAWKPHDWIQCFVR